MPWFPDDAYYYFKIAQLGGFTFDGINFTNGYHPLWMMLCVMVKGNLFACVTINSLLGFFGLKKMRDVFHAGDSVLDS